MRIVAEISDQYYSEWAAISEARQCLCLLNGVAVLVDSPGECRGAAAFASLGFVACDLVAAFGNGVGDLYPTQLCAGRGV